MQIKYLDLQAQYQSIKREIDDAMQKVLDNSAYVLGPAVTDFETEFASFCDVDHCAGVNSGTSALVMALRALDVGPGDEVVTSGNTFIATAAAIALVGAKPVLVDVDPGTRNIDPKLISMALSNRTKVIIPVHLYGRAADMDPILALARKHGVAVLEDAAQAQGAKYKGRLCGSIGTMAAFSFYPGKNLGAFGEAGAVTTNDSSLDEKVRMLRDHGSPKKYYHDSLGYNARMDGLQGAVLGVKLKHLKKWNEERRRVAALYDKLLADAPVTLPPKCDDDYSQVYHVYVIETDQRDKLQSYLNERQIPSLIHYPVPIHLQKAFAHLDYRMGDFPVTEKMAQEILSLPIYPEMTNEQVEFVADNINQFFRTRG